MNRSSFKNDDIEAALQSMRISEMDEIFEEKKGSYKSGN